MTELFWGGDGGLIGAVLFSAKAAIVLVLAFHHQQDLMSADERVCLHAERVLFLDPVRPPAGSGPVGGPLCSHNADDRSVYQL